MEKYILKNHIEMKNSGLLSNSEWLNINREQKVRQSTMWGKLGKVRRGWNQRFSARVVNDTSCGLWELYIYLQF